MTKNEKAVNQRIKEVMLERNVTSQEVAAKIGKHVTTIDRIIDEETKPTLGTIKAIANALSCPLEYLQKGIGPKEVADAPNDLQRENKGLHRENEGLWDLIKDFRAGKLSFLNPVKGTALKTGTHG